MPKYDLDKIKFGTDERTFDRAVGLYESGKVTEFKAGAHDSSAVVLGTKPYRVSVDNGHYDRGYCNCYLGERDTLCKHMVAVAVWAVKHGEPLTDEEKEFVVDPVCSNVLGVLSEEELAKTKKDITQALKYIKPYNGPSRTWFAYQNSLDEGCRRLTAIVSPFPVSEQTAKVLIDILLRLDKKLCVGGVDDSNGTVGGFMREVVEMLREYAALDQDCIATFKKLLGKETCFGWEEPLVRIWDEGIE